MIKFIKKISWQAWLFGGLSVIILGGMLLPGYVLTLDMTFTPYIHYDPSAGSFLNSAPVWYFLMFLNSLVPMWVVQKILLLALFFLIGFLAFKFLPLPKNSLGRYFGSFLYLFNPFVYERFLAGHWGILFTYAFLPPFIAYMLEYSRTGNGRDAAKMFGWLFLMSLFSLHIFTAGVLVMIAFMLVRIARGKFVTKYQEEQRKARNFIVWLFAFLFLSSYWMVPYVAHVENSVLERFDESHWEVFATDTDARMGTVFNVVSMYGFWNEGKPWAEHFLWPKEDLTFWLVGFSAIAVLVFWGIIYGLRKRSTRNRTLFFIALGSVAAVFSLGLGDSWARPINEWLFEHIFFWKGFRDSNKWSAFLVLAYAYLGSLGVNFIIESIKEKSWGKKYVQEMAGALALIPLIYTFTMLGGFLQQVKPIWFPESWEKARTILLEDQGDYKIISLPWHQYYSLNFNDNLVTANITHKFFPGKVITSQDMELIGKANQEKYLSSGEIDIQKAVEGEGDLTSEEAIAHLRQNRVKYILFLHDLEGLDSYQYRFLDSPELSPILAEKDLTLYRLGL